MDEAKCRSTAKTMAGLLIPLKSVDKFPSELPIAFAFALGLLIVNAGAETIKEVIEGETKKTVVPQIAFDSTRPGSILEDFFTRFLFSLFPHLQRF